MAVVDVPPRILNLTRAGNTVGFQVKAGHGMAYRVQTSSDLANWSVFSS